jgi:hypothetical protein
MYKIYITNSHVNESCMKNDRFCHRGSMRSMHQIIKMGQLTDKAGHNRRQYANLTTFVNNLFIEHPLAWLCQFIALEFGFLFDESNHR